MSLSSAIFALTGVKPEVKEPSTRKWSKYVKPQRCFSGVDANNEKVNVILDKNNQICGGYYAYVGYKGRPCMVDNGNVYCPVNIMVYHEDDEMYHSEFDHYEYILITKTKVD